MPDAIGQLTSNHGWNTIEHAAYLKEIIAVFKNAGIRVSILLTPVVELVAAAKDTGTDRIELYTEAFAKHYAEGKREEAIRDYKAAAVKLMNLASGSMPGMTWIFRTWKYFSQQVPGLLEVSIGYALICDAIYLGLKIRCSFLQKAVVITIVWYY